jgi:hypothetical protein
MRWLRRIPLKLTWALVALSLALGEWYPFSKFPMYSYLPAHESYFYVTDGADRAIPTTIQFGFSVGFIKKAHRSNLNRLRASGTSGADGGKEPAATSAEELAGVEILEYLVAQRTPRTTDPTPIVELRLYRVSIEMRDGSITRERALVARVRPRARRS